MPENIDLVERIGKFHYPDVWELLTPEGKGEYGKRLKALLQEFGLVMLDTDQTLPKNPYSVTVEMFHYIGYNVGQRDMLKANFKKVVQP